jgi:hypothetical protein
MLLQAIRMSRVSWGRAALLVAAICMGLSQPAQASLITRSVNVTLNAANVEMFDLDVNLDGATDFRFTAAFVPDPDFSVGFVVVDFPFASGNGVVVDSATGNGFPTASRLQVGNTVSAAQTFSGPNDQGNLFFFTPFDLPSGDFEGQTGFLGLRFDVAGGTLYGFAEVTVNSLNAPDNPLGLTIGTVGFSDTPGQPAQIAVVSEPGSLALVGIGVLGLLVRVRGKKARSKLQGSTART